MFDKFGEFDSAEELNKAAEGLKAEGDIESLKDLAIENGLDEMDAEDYANGDMPQLATVLTAALGKLAIEKADVRCEGIILDWLGYIESEAAEDEQFASLDVLSETVEIDVNLSVTYLQRAIDHLSLVTF